MLTLEADGGTIAVGMDETQEFLARLMFLGYSVT